MFSLSTCEHLSNSENLWSESMSCQIWKTFWLIFSDHFITLGCHYLENCQYTTNGVLVGSTENGQLNEGGAWSANVPLPHFHHLWNKTNVPFIFFSWMHFWDFIEIAPVLITKCFRTSSRSHCFLQNTVRISAIDLSIPVLTFYCDFVQMSLNN